MGHQPGPPAPARLSNKPTRRIRICSMFDFLKKKISTDQLGSQLAQYALASDGESVDLSLVKQRSQIEVNDTVFLVERRCLRLFIALQYARTVIRTESLWDPFMTSFIRAVQSSAESLGFEWIFLTEVENNDDYQPPTRFTEILFERFRIYTEVCNRCAPIEQRVSICEKFETLCRQGRPRGKYDSFLPFASATYKLMARDLDKLAGYRVV